MSAGEFHDVDRDLLADYVGGALEGTPDHARVARLIHEEPAWAEAYHALITATQAVRADLAAWGAHAEPMPPDVAERLTAALRHADRHPPRDDRAPLRIPVARTPQRPPDTRPAPPPASPGSPRRGASHAGRRWVRWGIPGAIAAGMSALVALGVTHLLDEPDDTTLAGRDGVHGSATAPARVTTSGSDYTAATLPRLAALAAADSSSQPLAAEAESMTTTPGEQLRPFVDAALLAACLEDVATEHGHGPIKVHVVDFAAFEGHPALVVVFTNATGERWVWVAGPDCGHGGADTRYATRVG